LRVAILSVLLVIFCWNEASEQTTIDVTKKSIPPMERISDHISYIDSVKSATATAKGIENVPSDTHLVAMRDVAKHCFEPIRNHFKVPIGIRSFYRCPDLNKAVGGSKNSDHMKGAAIDMDADIYGRITNKQIFDYAYDNLDYDQLIGEGHDKATGTWKWVHISWRKEGNRKETKIANFDDKGNLVGYEWYKPETAAQ
jgi:zinc D-Ala-D-Ala carboxypeptidase